MATIVLYVGSSAVLAILSLPLGSVSGWLEAAARRVPPGVLDLGYLLAPLATRGLAFLGIWLVTTPSRDGPPSGALRLAARGCAALTLALVLVCSVRWSFLSGMGLGPTTALLYALDASLVIATTLAALGWLGRVASAIRGHDLADDLATAFRILLVAMPLLSATIAILVVSASNRTGALMMMVLVAHTVLRLVVWVSLVWLATVLRRLDRELGTCIPVERGSTAAA